MSLDIFAELSVIIFVAVVVVSVVRLLKQPLIIGYILTGIIVSPYFLDVVRSQDAIATFAQVGVALLLFMVGLNMNPSVIKDVGKVSLLTGIGQVAFTSLVGFLISRFLGFSVISSLYIAIALSFSSTIIIMKLLSDKNDIDTLYGRISIGFLIVQDLIAVFMLMTISSFSKEGTNLLSKAFETFVTGFTMFGFLVFIGLLFLPKITAYVARSQELLMLFSISWALAVATLFNYLNFSIEIGSLFAGIVLSISPYRYEIMSKMRPLRDFFVVLFFVLLGSQMVFENIANYIIPVIIFSLFILVGNPIIVMTIMGLLGYTKRNSFLAGLTVAQISEFSLILLALGVSMGHLSIEILSMVTVVGLITMAGSTYFIMYSNKLYPMISKYLSVFEIKGSKVDELKYDKTKKYDVVVFGYNRIGYTLLNSFKKIKKKFLVIDYNPDTIRILQNRQVDCVYGDASDSELLNDINLTNTKMVISTIPEIETNLLLIRHAKGANKKCIVIVIAHKIDDAIALYDSGASYVIMPHFLGGDHASAMIERYGLNVDRFLQGRIRHIEHLRRRKSQGHEHPTEETHRNL
jgi:Kef-type K+ transport system membrane component KefB/Trk K+ transport system NAD-binding subunit